MKNYGFAVGNLFSPESAEGYASSRLGRRYCFTHQTPGTGVTGQTSYAATTPTFLFYRASAGTRFVLCRVVLMQTGTVAGGPIRVAIVTDTINRYSSGGTAIAGGQTSREASARTAETIFRTGATASAASAAKVHWSTGWPQSLGRSDTIDFRDGLIIGSTGSILVYTFPSTGTAPTWYFTFEGYEEDL